MLHWGGIMDEVREGLLLDDLRVLIDERSLRVGGSWQLSTEKEPIAYDIETIRFFYERTLEFQHPIVLDIGANTGSFCLLAKKI